MFSAPSLIAALIVPPHRMQAHSVQRSNFVDDHGYYQNKSKMAFRGLAKK